MAKKHYSFRLSNDAIARLHSLCEENSLGQGPMIERLILSEKQQVKVASAFNDDETLITLLEVVTRTLKNRERKEE